MADFTCEPGKVLTRQEAEAMIAYDNAGVRRPDGYNDVIQENGLSGLVYRCKTKEEKGAEDASVKADAERTERVMELENSIKKAEVERIAKQEGIDPASVPIMLNSVRTPVADAGPSGGEGGTAPATGSEAGDGDASTRRRSS